MDKSFETKGKTSGGREINGVKSFLLDLKNTIKEKYTENKLKRISFTSFEFLEEERADGNICTGIRFLDYMAGRAYEPSSPKQFACCMFGLNSHCIEAIKRHGDAFRERVVEQAGIQGWNDTETKIVLDISLARIENLNKNYKSNKESLNSENENE